jgi:hypothetical protein
MQEIDEFVKSHRDVIYLNEPDRKKRAEIHQYVRDNFKNYISRTEYMSHGLEYKCCGKWYRSSEYGNSWNGGYVFCDVCKEYTTLNFDDCDDLYGEDVRLSNYKPTDQIMICKKGFAYKRSYNYPFSYRKHY